MSYGEHGEVDELFRRMESLKHEVCELNEERGALWDAVNELVEDLKKGKYAQPAKTVSEAIAVSPDSVTVGAPSNGQVKIYGDASDCEAFKEKVHAMKEVLAAAKQAVNGDS